MKSSFIDLFIVLITLLSHNIILEIESIPLEKLYQSSKHKASSPSKVKTKPVKIKIDENTNGINADVQQVNRLLYQKIIRDTPMQKTMVRPVIDEENEEPAEVARVIEAKMYDMTEYDLLNHFQNNINDTLKTNQKIKFLIKEEPKLDVLDEYISGNIPNENEDDKIDPVDYLYKVFHRNENLYNSSYQNQTKDFDPNKNRIHNSSSSENEPETSRSDLIKILENNSAVLEQSTLSNNSKEEVESTNIFDYFLHRIIKKLKLLQFIFDV